MTQTQHGVPAVGTHGLWLDLEALRVLVQRPDCILVLDVGFCVL